MTNENIKQYAENSSNTLIENGYVYNEIFGWEKPEIIESFGLNVNMSGVPCVLRDEVEYKEEVVYIKDSFGNKTGEKMAKKYPLNTGKKVLGVSDNYLAYLQFKRDSWAKYDAEEYAKKINTPPLKAFYNNF